MYERIRVWMFVIVLGVVLPSVLLKINPNKPVQTTNPTEQAPAKQSILLMDEDEKFTAIGLEEYTLCVVLGEMPADFEAEALKAQAVLARTYALKRTQVADKHPQGAVCTESSCCQAFCTKEAYLEAGNDVVDLLKITEAVESTSGQVLTYGGQLIEATYFSCSGGRTEDAAAVWGTDIPYLQATDSPGEEESQHYTTTVQLTKNEVASKLRLPESQLQIQSVTYTDGGGVDIMRIDGVDFTGVQLRQLLELKSTAFQMTVVGEHVIITTKGFGHRVGMSQYGADAMALSGSGYAVILSHYYPGTVLTQYSQ